MEGVGSLHVTDLRARNVQVSLEGVGSGELAVDCVYVTLVILPNKYRNILVIFQGILSCYILKSQ